MRRQRHEPGTARIRRDHPRFGHGTAWLVADRTAGDFRCYWYGGAGDSHLRETATAATAAAAVRWGRRRTTHVRIRTADGLTTWAGTAPRPRGVTSTWVDGSDGDAGRATPASHDPGPR